MVFGRDTSASFSRDQNDVSLQLTQGNVSLYQPNGSTRLRVQAGSVSVVAASGFKTLCQVAMVGNAIVVTAEKGSVRVEGNGAPVEVAEGKAITIQPRTGRAPQAAGGTQHYGGNGTEWLAAGALGAGVTAAILAGIGMSRSNDAKTDALAAEAAANAADSDAKAATAAANAAAADANAAAGVGNAAGCAVNVLANDAGYASPYMPPPGYSCASGG
jgi:hypothetical protein